MPNDMPVYNTLTSMETRLVQLMRRFPVDDDHAPVAAGDSPVYARLEVPLMRFLDLLWQADPFIVALNHRYDYDVTVFELQLLYAVNEARAGNVRTINELLAWWFPEHQIAEARASLSTVAHILDEEGMPRQSGARLREHILGVSSKRVKNSYRFVLETDSRSRAPSACNNQTIH
ncbi:MAG: hypothetical protein WD075_02345 [Rhodospirillales bacterium]